MRRAFAATTTVTSIRRPAHRLMSRRVAVEFEVVEDSEPERELERQQRKLERKKRKLDLATPKVIVISDESATASPAPVSPQSVIDISDSSSQNLVSLSTSVAAPGNEPDEEVVPTLNLARFAFKSTHPLQQRNSASTIGSSSNSDVPVKAPARSSGKDLDTEISDTDLKKLAKCVSCEIAWTTRKTAAQKRIHIGSCSTRHGITDETLVFLVRKEIENMPAAASSKGKGKASAPNTTGPSTLLEELVRDAAPKRKGKRRDPIDILKNASETRGNILDRARTLLDTESDRSFIPRTQAVTSDAAAPPPSTQAFGGSRFGQQPGRRLLGDQESDEELEPPPPTQAFVPSKLGGGAIRTSGWGYESESELEDQPAVSKLSSAKDASRIVYPTTKTKANTPVTLVKLDAYVCNDPERSDANAMPVTIPKKTKRQTKKQSTIAEDIAPTTTTTTRRRNKAAAEELDEPALLKKILADEELHRQILRYQAIDFSTLLALVLKPDQVASARIKLQLRVFLDKQAIIFFGGEAGKPRARTRKKR
ncbi:hypothetical protein C8F01DRAFT_1118118 [Mycena amicta]|nr:hypothetical protein C8F01DRAFT_1118118 [Mycena amicta]